MRRMLVGGLAALVMLGAGVGCSGGGGRAAPSGASEHASGSVAEAVGSGGVTELYTRQVLPILKKDCYRCHGGMNHRGGLNLQTQAGMMKGGKSGRDVIPGDPDGSPLVISMRHQGSEDHPKPMPPPPRPKVSDADIEVIARWVREGALMPPDVEKP